MQKGALRYIADTIAIEDLASDLQIEKTAGLFDELGFSSIASSIVSKIKSAIGMDENMGTGDKVKLISKMLVSGALFKLNPLLWVTWTVADFMGVDLIGIGKNILDAVFDATKDGGQVTFSDIDHQGKIAIGMYNRGLVKQSLSFGNRRRYRGGQKVDIPFLPKKGASKIERVFGNLFRIGAQGRLKTLLIAILIWTLKTALLGVGVMAGAGIVANIVKGDKSNKTHEEETDELEKNLEPEEEPERTSEELVRPVELKRIMSGPKPSGRGEERHKNDQEPGGYMWMVPLYGSIENTLAGWATDVYNGFTGYEDIIYRSPDFRRMVNKFKGLYEPGSSSTLVPEGYTSRKQVVDSFAKDVFRKIRGKNE